MFWGSMPWKLTRMQSSKFFAGLQWNIPVESYFISVFSKSKSFAWSSAIPTCRLLLLLTLLPLPADALFVGLQYNEEFAWGYRLVSDEIFFIAFAWVCYLRCIGLSHDYLCISVKLLTLDATYGFNDRDCIRQELLCSFVKCYVHNTFQ